MSTELISFAEMEEKFLKEILANLDEEQLKKTNYNTYSLAAGFAMGHGYKQGKSYMFAKSLMDRDLVC